MKKSRARSINQSSTISKNKMKKSLRDQQNHSSFLPDPNVRKKGANFEEYNSNFIKEERIKALTETNKSFHTISSNKPNGIVGMNSTNVSLRQEVLEKYTKEKPYQFEVEDD